MIWIMVILRLIHIFSAFIWAGAAFSLVLFVGPTARAVGADGQKFMQHFTLRSPFQRLVSIAAGLTVLSGLIMYYRLFGFLAPLNTGAGLALTIGGLAGLAAMGEGIGQGRKINRLRALSGELEAAGGKPTPEQASELGHLQEKMAAGGARLAVLLVIALAGMTLSEYFAI